jgi:Tfp pilus assembly protein PilE
MKRNKGISLIVLVITIIVIIILAGSVILSLSNSNPIIQANQARLKTTADAYNSELLLSITKQYVLDSSFVATSFNARVWDGVSSTTGTIKQYIPSITTQDALKYEIQNSKLVYVGSVQDEKNWLAEMNITNGAALPPLYGTVAVNVIATSNSTINGASPTYSNPIIPNGFKAINDGTVWPTNWNTGLVIQDALGNQFVWVPVDGTSVTYAKWCTKGSSYTTASDDILPAGITSETNQITKYGGFYIARYEAGKEGASTLVSKKVATVWSSITYNLAKTTSETMYNTLEIKSGLVTGTEWDSAMKWIQNAGISVVDSRVWGNHVDSISPANIIGFGTLKTTGFSEYWKCNNIYDLAGNVGEWSNELLASGVARAYRGGMYTNDGINCPASVRNSDGPNGVHPDCGFRIALYIL